MASREARTHEETALNFGFDPQSPLILNNSKKGKLKIVLEALNTNNKNLLLSDISKDFSIGDLKEMIISAMLTQRMLLQEVKNEPLEDWKINDTKVWYYKDWLEIELKKY